MTKIQILNEISEILKTTGEEFVVTKYPEMREPNRGLHPYIIRYVEKYGKVMVCPWSGAERCWDIPLKRVPKKSLLALRQFVEFTSEFERSLV